MFSSLPVSRPVRYFSVGTIGFVDRAAIEAEGATPSYSQTFRVEPAVGERGRTVEQSRVFTRVVIRVTKNAV